ncbi:MAG: hypothetical protein FJW13_04510 [Actinobacteria bacterium]|nr:hypothetical protein [Actinomycetota bacterium]
MIRRIPARVVSLLVVALSVVALPSSPVRAVDYRLEIVTGNFTTRIGERVIITIATPNDDDITTLLTDPAATATADVSAPLVTRESVTAIVAGGAFESESQTSLVGPLFRATTLNGAEVFQLNLPTSAAARPNALRLTREGLRVLRVTVTAPSGRIAQLTTFLNVISNRTYAPLPVYFVVDIDGAPSMQPDGTIRLGDAERERLLDLRDLIYRKPPAVQVSIRIRPELIDALTRSSSPDDPQLLADLVGKLPENDVLVGTFRPTSVAAYAAAELKAAFEAQLLRGETVLDAVNGPTLSTRTTWLTNEALDAAAVDLLRGYGVTNVVAVGDAVRAYGTGTDTARPYAMRSSTNGVVLSLADTRYARLLDQPTGTAHESAVAIAAELLAQRAAIANSAIGPAALANRQVVLASAAGVPEEPLITTTLLKLLRAAPQLSLRSSRDLTPSLEGLARIQPPAITSVDALAIQTRTNAALAAVESVREVLATNAGVTDNWTEVIDVANDTSLTEERRNDYLQAVLTQVDSVRNAVALPSSSFTFGSRESQLRLSLDNSSNFALSMRLQAASPAGKMTFTPSSIDIVIPANGQREVVFNATARSNGLIPVELMLMSPSGAVLDVAEVRVRVNAIAGLGRGVSAVFLVLLAAWWGIHTRRQIKQRKAKEHPALRSRT